MMSVRQPFSDIVAIVLNKGDIKSLFCLVIFCIVFLVLAYLTNPSENSFRSYLTEQSFRQHLSRLDDGIDEDQPSSSRSIISLRRDNAVAHNTLPFDNRSPFHFANRASVCLRTPKHAFHSFGIFTVAAIVPSSKADRRRAERPNTMTDVLMITDSWFIGAFGRWWRGGILEAWYQDVISRSNNDEESWSSGILGMKTLDRTHEYSAALPGLPFSTKSLPPHGLSRGSPPRLRNREKSSQRLSPLSARSSTPPPLPKSAVLPLHTSRVPQALVNDRGPLPSLSQPSTPAAEQMTSLTSPVVPPASALFDQSPHVVELLHQISVSKASVLELRNQLADCQTSASQSHTALQEELDTHRERKRLEDSAARELKSRTKTLDDSKRAAEGARKEVEKRLKAAEHARDDATERMEYLDQQIAGLQARLCDDQDFIRNIRSGAARLDDANGEIAKELESKRREIKVAEDVVAALNLRARELEDRLSREKAKLQAMREDADRRRGSVKQVTGSPSSSHTDALSSPIGRPLEDSHVSDGPAVVGPKPDVQDLKTSPRPNKLLLGNLSNFSNQSSLPVLRTNGLPMFDEGTGARRLSTNFSPFAADTPLTPSRGAVLSPTSTSLIPTGLITSMDTTTDNVSMSFRSESDVRMDRDWRNQSINGDPSLLSSPRDRSPGYIPMTSSPVSLVDPSNTGSEYDPFEVRMLSHDERDREQYSSSPSENCIDMQRVSVPHRHNSDPNSSSVYGHDEVADVPFGNKPASARRWYSISRDKTKKGLNPDAKAFSLGRTRGTVGIGNGTYDALNPNGLGPSMVPSTSADSTSLLRAFAPSPAEREALQRALGGSTNTSLERLPSLSDVGSIPSSPSHVHARAVAPPPPNKGVPSWLSTLPRLRKPNFSPWEDEQPVAAMLEEGGGSKKTER